MTEKTKTELFQQAFEAVLSEDHATAWALMTEAPAPNGPNAQVLAIQGYTLMDAGSYGGALELFLNSLISLQQDPHPPTQALVLNGLAWIYHLHGVNSVALRCIDSAIHLCRSNRLLGQLGHNLNTAGAILGVSANAIQAETLLRQAQQLSAENGQVLIEAIACNNLANTRILLGNPADAVTLIDRALVLIEGMDVPGRLAQFYDTKAMVSLALGSPAAAKRWLESAIESAKRSQSAPGPMEFHFNMGNLLMQDGQPQAAAQHLQKALRLALASDSYRFTPACYLALSGCHEAAGEVAIAFEYYQLYHLHSAKTRDVTENLFGLDPLDLATSAHMSNQNTAEHANQITYLVTTDPITELFNRVHFRHLASLALAADRHANQTTSLLMVNLALPPGDVDHTAALRSTAQAITQTIRVGDVACRHNNGQFLVLLANTQSTTATTMAKELANRLAQSNANARIASAQILPTDEHLTDALNRMDLAMERTARQGNPALVVL